jgi:hypothetical protein
MLPVNTKRMDYLVRKLTAANSLAALVEMIGADYMGQVYVPTIHARDAQHKELIRGLRELGYKVWGNNGKNWK